MKLKPAGAGEPLDSDPLATEAFPGFAQLTLVTTTTSTGPDGTEVADVITAEGVLYRARPDGTVLDAMGTPTTSGEVALSTDQARETAQRFAEANLLGFTTDWQIVADEPISHLAGDALQLLRWRPVDAGKAGAREVTVEIDRRTGAVVYFSATGGGADAGEEPTAAFAVSESEAVAAAREAVGDDRGIATAVADTWQTSRWIVTVDRGLTGRPEALVHDVDRIEIDARTGAVLSRTTV
ncbi:PepSY domain-containing protein [Streptomyces himalayensis]|uniref:PepSY domain-containing protein n=1 Tax=Streptomyces himalayensis subsp. himalayensis TaxID=2756131 RepID=A0A7W0DI92_9ACTN|nr:PepSY domain-containing protein [Streptomyces himalayensis]MBA2944859.1 PepSY domain-containing protein [Streptomyces himalayensis subsp. himalayensis]